MLEDGRRHCATVVLTLRGALGAGRKLELPDDHLSMMKKVASLAQCSLRDFRRRWFKSKLTVHKQIYDSIKQKVTNLAEGDTEVPEVLLWQGVVRVLRWAMTLQPYRYRIITFSAGRMLGRITRVARACCNPDSEPRFWLRMFFLLLSFRL